MISNVGTWMHDAGAAWMMTTISDSPLFVALIQAATSFPIFLLAFPAGALADIVDRRRYLLAVQAGMLIVAANLAALTFLQMVSPWSLLALTFGLGIGAALNAPAFQATIPELVPRKELQSAVALSSAGINVSRAIGPTLGGIIIAAAGPGAAFALNALSFVGIIFVLYRWHRDALETTLPAERFVGAMRVGVRYVRESPRFITVVARALLFFLFASAAWALLPLIARTRLEQGPVGYGLTLGAIGTGAVTGAVILPRILRRVSVDLLSNLCSLAFASATFTLGFSKNFHVALGASLLAGMSWLAVLPTLNTEAQGAVPAWVRARALSVYLVVFFGAMALGSILWGALASRWGIPTALTVASIGLILGIPCAHWLRLGSPLEIDHAPSMHWPAPMVAQEIGLEEGPTMVLVEYHIDPGDSRDFAILMQQMRRIRRRDGAVSWSLFKDASRPERFIEYFTTPSWVEHLRQHERITVSDREIEERVRAFHKGDTPPLVSHFIVQPPVREDEK